MSNTKKPVRKDGLSACRESLDTLAEVEKGRQIFRFCIRRLRITVVIRTRLQSLSYSAFGGERPRFIPINLRPPLAKII